MTSRRHRRAFVDDLPKTHDLRYGLLFLVGLVLSAGVLYGIGFVVAGDKVPPGTTIGGVAVGGMTRGEATAALQDELAARIEHPLTLVAAGRTYRVDPQRSGFAFDLGASISDAMSGSDWDPRHMLAVLMGGHDLAPVILVDNRELDKVLGRVSDDVDRTPKDAFVAFTTGGPQVAFGRTGQRLDRQGARARLVAALQSGKRRAVLPVRSVQPGVTDTEATNFAHTVGTPAANGRITLRVAGSTISLRPGRFVPALTTRVVDSGLRLAADPRQLYRRSRHALASLPSAPVDASVAWGRTHPVVVPGRQGTTVGPQDLSRAVLKAVRRPTRRAWCAPTTAGPAFTTRDAHSLQVRSRVAAFNLRRSTLPYSALKGAARQLGGTLLKPGDTFSFLATVDARRFQPAASRLAGATYAAAFRAGVSVLQRTPEKHYDAAFPEGLGARVAPPHHNLVLRNDSPYGVYLATSVRRSRGGTSRLEVAVWSSRYWRVQLATSRRHSVIDPGTRVLRSRSCSPRPGIAGFPVDVTRTFYRSGKKARSDLTHTTYAPLEGIRCR